MATAVIISKYVDLSRYILLLIKFVKHSFEVLSCNRTHDNSLIFTPSEATESGLLAASSMIQINRQI
jgi:hypothetical protein